MMVRQALRLMLGLLVFQSSPVEANRDGPLITNNDGTYEYYLYFSKTGYSWDSAKRQCSTQKTSLMTFPASEGVRDMIHEWDVARNVWITDAGSNCMTLKSECTQRATTAFGNGHCIVYSVKSVATDCGSSKRFVICTAAYRPTTTVIRTTEPPTTTPITTLPTTPVTTRPPPTTPVVVTTPAPTTKNPSMVENKLSTPEVTGEEKADRSPSVVVAQKKNKHEGGMAGFMLGLAMAKTDLLGLIIGVVTGTFLILTLVFVLCCACQGQASKNTKRRTYDLVERASDSSLSGEGKNVSNASTNTLEAPYRTVTTEESSIEMSDARSHSTKQSDQEVHVTSCYPPPPSLYDTPNDVYSILPTVNRHQRRQNPLYNIPHASPGGSVLSEELPLPPPPLPPHGVTIVEESDEEREDLCIKGLNPTFKTFLDKTIAVKPMNIHGTGYHPPQSPSYRVVREGSAQEKRGLMTSDL